MEVTVIFFVIYTQKLTDADISMLLKLVNEKLGEDL